LRKKLSKLLDYPTKEYWGQYFNEHRAKECNVVIKLNTVDRFQGQEADIVFLSMVQTDKIGFLGSPNRLNVALTRARFQLVVFGKKDYYCDPDQNNSDDLKALANDLKTHREPRP
jgi:superfamily I DNA and/or RNA helicase